MSKAYLQFRDKAVAAVQNNGGEFRRVRIDKLKTKEGDMFDGRQIRMYAVSGGRKMVQNANKELAGSGIKLDLESLGVITADMMRNPPERYITVVEE